MQAGGPPSRRPGNFVRWRLHSSRSRPTVLRSGPPLPFLPPSVPQAAAPRRARSIHCGAEQRLRRERGRRGAPAALTLRVRKGDHGGGGGEDRGASGPTLRSLIRRRATGTPPGPEPPRLPETRSRRRRAARPRAIGCSQANSTCSCWDVRRGSAPPRQSERRWLVIGGGGRSGRVGAAGRWREGV